MKHKYLCTGVKACEYLHNDIASLYHYEANSEIWQTICDTRKDKLNIGMTPTKLDAIR